MKVALLNDTSTFHCGCKAVILVLEKQIAACGGTITLRLSWEEVANKSIINPERYKDVDIIIINGEGSMHRGRCGNILKSVTPWIGRKKIYLVNSVWDNQPPEYANIVAKFDRVFAREIISADNMVAQGVPASKVTIFPDLSIQADIGNPTIIYDFENTIGRTNSYCNWGDGPQTEKRELHIDNVWNWRQFVQTIATAKAMYTGLHHGMYACIKARTPFVVYKHNCCKILGLLSTFGVEDEIRIVERPQDLQIAMKWCLQNISVFERLFDKVANHSKFELKDYL